MRWRGATAWVVVFAALVVASRLVIESEDVQDRSEQSSSSNASAARSAKVLRVVDGDTILVRDDSGGTERIRYIGVDTPESVKPNTPVQCYGHEASNYNKSLVQGKTVRLVPDHEPLDKYGRSLAYVYANGKLVQSELLAGGYARTLEIPPNTSRAAQFAKLEDVAIRTNKGLWRECDR